MAKYEIEKDEDGYPLVCFACGSEVPTTKVERVYPLKNPPERLCELCHTTMIGRALIYPTAKRQEATRYEVAHLIAQATHYLERKLSIDN